METWRVVEKWKVVGFVKVTVAVKTRAMTIERMDMRKETVALVEMESQFDISADCGSYLYRSEIVRLLAIVPDFRQFMTPCLPRRTPLSHFLISFTMALAPAIAKPIAVSVGLEAV